MLTLSKEGCPEYDTQLHLITMLWTSFIDKTPKLTLTLGGGGGGGGGGIMCQIVEFGLVWFYGISPFEGVV